MPMRWKVGTKIAMGFGVVLAIFVVVGLVSYRGTSELIEASDLRQQSFNFLRQLDEARLVLVQLESAQRSFVLTGDESYREHFVAATAGLDPALQRLRKAAADGAGDGRRVESLEPLIKTRVEVARESVDLMRSQGQAAAAQLVKAGRGKAAMEQIDRIAREMEREEESLLAQRAEATLANARIARSTIVLGTVIGFVLAAVAALAITRNIAVPLHQLTAVAGRIARGDLGVQVPSHRREDEVGALARAFEDMLASLRSLAQVAEHIAAGNLSSTPAARSEADVLGKAFARMAENLREQIRAIVEGAVVIGSAGSQIAASTTQLAASASQSAAAVTETTTTVEEVRQTAHLASQKAQNVADSAQRAAEIAQRGRKSADDVVAGINRIRQQMEGIAASMMRLGEQGHAIGQIIATVDDLAAQSNLLAVNAAMEAARAGEAGKGFSVVAQEVKSLAEQSRRATSQVRGILTDIQKATTAAVLATEEGTKAVEAGAAQTAIAGESIRALAESVSDAAQAATQIAATSQQQLVGVDQVAGAMTSILEASNQNVTSAKQLEAAARDLNELGGRLRQTVERYQV